MAPLFFPAGSQDKTPPQRRHQHLAAPDEPRAGAPFRRALLDVDVVRADRIEVHGYCLVLTHFHLLVQSLTAKLAEIDSDHIAQPLDRLEPLGDRGGALVGKTESVAERAPEAEAVWVSMSMACPYADIFPIAAANLRGPPVSSRPLPTGYRPSRLEPRHRPVRMSAAALSESLFLHQTRSDPAEVIEFEPQPAAACSTHPPEALDRRKHSEAALPPGVFRGEPLLARRCGWSRIPPASSPIPMSNPK